MANILYVDDEAAIGLILQDTLERLGHSAIGAQNVPEALGALARGDIDLIISDFRMPGLSGLEFLELLKDQGRDIPLIMLTGYAGDEDVDAVRRQGLTVLAKPVDLRELRAAIQSNLSDPN